MILLGIDQALLQFGYQKFDSTLPKTKQLQSRQLAACPKLFFDGARLMQSLAQVFSFSRNGLILITSTLMMSCLVIEAAKAQSQPSCYMVTTSGEVVNLEAICNVKSQRQLKSHTATLINNLEDVYLVGNGNNPFTLGTSSTIYYSGKSPAYFRRYREPQRFSSRDDARNALLGTGRNTRSLDVSGRTPFIIYRYQP